MKCPECGTTIPDHIVSRALVGFAEKHRRNLGKEPITRDDLYRQQLHPYKSGVCSRCGVRLPSYEETGWDRRKGEHHLKECSDVLLHEIAIEGLIE